MATKSAETIHTLLDAEKEAAQVVDKAKKDRDARLKQAASEAQAEIAAYRAQKEAQYQEQVQKFAGSSGDITKKIEADTAKSIQEMGEMASQNKEQVVKMLVDYVLNVDTQYTPKKSM